MATQAQLELQASVRMNALENVDIQLDIQNWEKQMKSKEKRIKSEVAPSTSGEPSRSMIYKIEGSKCYEAKNFAKAIVFYSKAIEADRSGKLSSVLYRNRALCQFKLANMEECVIDCNESLRLEPSNEKTLFRRMEANYQLKNVQMVEKDFNLILTINPKHTAALEFQSRWNIEQENNKKNRSDYGLGYKSTIDGVGEELQFVKIPTHKQFNKPLRRIRVTTKANDASALEVGPGVEKNAQNIAVGPTKDVISVNGTSKVQGPPKWSTIGSNGIDISFIEKPTTISKFTELKHIQIGDKNSLVESKVTKEQENLAIKSDVSIPTIPLSAATFYKTWTNLKEPRVRYAWLKELPFIGFVDLLGGHLDSVLLSELLLVFSDFFVPNRIPAMPYLREIAKSDQLPILSMMMSNEDKRALSTILEFTKQLYDEEIVKINNAFSV